MAFRRSPLVVLLAGAVAAACTRPAPEPAPVVAAGPAIPPRKIPDFPESWRFPARLEAAFAPHAMIASNDRFASAAGIEILQQGGNAVDAAVATGFALAVTHPEAGNLGGGGYMVIRLADGRVAALDYREVAPLAATRDMYLDPATGRLTEKSVVGYLASGVPGAVAGMAAALERYGTMTLAQVLEPAIRLATNGFIVDSNLSRSLRGDSALLMQFAGGEVFLPHGEVPRPGATLRQPMLARTLRLIAERGPSVFYRGEIADSIVAEMRRGGGIITREDLARYRPEWREPVSGEYRGYRLYSMPLSSSGGITMIETLNILEHLGTMPPFESARFKHNLAAAYQRAFIDRNSKLGDPAFVHVPVQELTSDAYARRLALTIPRDRATPTVELTPQMTSLREGNQTTHYSVVDQHGNAVATTTTINSLYGSGVYVRGAGFFLNNEMDDFAAQPGVANQFGLVQGEQNAIAPGKRMLSAMSPTIVLDPRGDLLLVVGGRGGPRIITATSQIILNVIDHRMTLADAMVAPRIHHQALPDAIRYEQGGLDAATEAALRAMGYTLEPVSAIGSTTGVMRAPGGWHGMVDPRSYGGAVGW